MESEIFFSRNCFVVSSSTLLYWSITFTRWEEILTRLERKITSNAIMKLILIADILLLSRC